jgi:hypothetical protein
MRNNEKQHQIQKPLTPLNKKLEIFVRSLKLRRQKGKGGREVYLRIFFAA